MNAQSILGIIQNSLAANAAFLDEATQYTASFCNMLKTFLRQNNTIKVEPPNIKKKIPMILRIEHANVIENPEPTLTRSWQKISNSIFCNEPIEKLLESIENKLTVRLKEIKGDFTNEVEEIEKSIQDSIAEITIIDQQYQAKNQEYQALCQAIEKTHADPAQKEKYDKLKFKFKGTQKTAVEKLVELNHKIMEYNLQIERALSKYEETEFKKFTNLYNCLFDFCETLKIISDMNKEITKNVSTEVSTISSQKDVNNFIDEPALQKRPAKIRLSRNNSLPASHSSSQNSRPHLPPNLLYIPDKKEQPKEQNMQNDQNKKEDPQNQPNKEETQEQSNDKNQHNEEIQPNENPIQNQQQEAPQIIQQKEIQPDQSNNNLEAPQHETNHSEISHPDINDQPHQLANNLRLTKSSNPSENIIFHDSKSTTTTATTTSTEEQFENEKEDNDDDLFDTDSLDNLPDSTLFEITRMFSFDVNQFLSPQEIFKNDLKLYEAVLTEDFGSLHKGDEVSVSNDGSKNITAINLHTGLKITIDSSKIEKIYDRKIMKVTSKPVDGELEVEVGEYVLVLNEGEGFYKCMSVYREEGKISTDKLTDYDGK